MLAERWTQLALLLLWAERAPARPDLVFQVPEVLVRHAAAPRPVGTGPTLNRAGDKFALHQGGDQSALRQGGNQSALTAESERTDYFIEHEISTADAKKAAQLLKLEDVAESLPGCGTCSRWEREYCRGGVLADHCCCERRYMPEPLPWLPHSCYIGPQRCQPQAANCAHYARIRDCCCIRHMAERWKSILSKAPSPALGAGGASLLLLGGLLLARLL